MESKKFVKKQEGEPIPKEQLKKLLHDQKVKEYELEKRRPIAGGGIASGMRRFNRGGKV